MAPIEPNARASIATAQPLAGGGGRLRRSSWAAGSALALLAACGGGEEVSDLPLPDDTPVILVVIDTLRADHLSCYDYGLETSPVLDAFARTATVFENNTTQCNSTFPSITSIMTGLYPRTHRNYLAVPIEGTFDQSRSDLSLAERLQYEDYVTLAVGSHPSWQADIEDSALRRGWDEFSVIPWGKIPIPRRPLFAHGEFTNERAFKLLEGYPEDAVDPLFLWAHYFDPHTDLKPSVYNAPEPFRNRYLGHHLEAVGHPEAEAALAPLEPAVRHEWIATLEPEEHRNAVRLANGRALYDAEIASCDYQVGRLFDKLRERGLYDDALIIVMADHGENMEAHDEFRGNIAFSHLRLFEGVSHTPLILKLPGQTEGRRVSALTQNVDVLPTVMELLALPPRPEPEGMSLLPLLRDERASVHKLVFSESSDHVEKAVKTERWKRIEPGKGREPLHFLWREDEGETVDRTAELEAPAREALALALSDFKPEDRIHLHFAPDAEAYRVHLVLELGQAAFAPIEGLREGELSPDRKRLELERTIEDAPFELELEPERRNTSVRISLTVDGVAPRPDRVQLGQTPLPRTTAIPLWKPGSAPPPKTPLVIFRRRPEDRRVDLVFPNLGARESLREATLRYATPSYQKQFSEVHSSGFGPGLQEGRATTYRIEADPTGHAKCGLAYAPEDDDVLCLLRIDGHWPPRQEVSLDDTTPDDSRLEFLWPFPLDPRLTTTLMAAPDVTGLPGGTLAIWTQGGGPLEIDTTGMNPEVVENLRVLGYLPDDESED